jgi:GTP-binding protein
MSLESEKLFAQETKFVIGATRIIDIPPVDIPEVAFIGRSNVGKSSIINALLNRRIAKVSNTPGRTRQANFFLVGSRMHVVDLPGYGYAKASKKDIKGWNDLIYDYLRGRVQLRRIFMLIDSRQGIKPNDLEMLEFLSDYANPIQLILTKADKLSAKEVESVQQAVQAECLKHAICLNNTILTSSVSKSGIKELREEIYTLLQY